MELGIGILGILIGDGVLSRLGEVLLFGLLVAILVDGDRECGLVFFTSLTVTPVPT